MWNGKWSSELSSLYDIYYDLFETEPDCDFENNCGTDFDSVSYNEFKQKIIRSITMRKRIY